MPPKGIKLFIGINNIIIFNNKYRFICICKIFKDIDPFIYGYFFITIT